MDFGLLLVFLCFAHLTHGAGHMYCDCHDRAAEYTNSNVQFKSICHLPDIFFMIVHVPVISATLLDLNPTYYAIHNSRPFAWYNNVVGAPITKSGMCAISGISFFICSLLFLSIRMKEKKYVHTFQFNWPISSFSRSTGDLVMWKIRISNDESFV